MTNFLKAVGLLVGALSLIFIFALLSGLPVWLLWNWLCPELFNLPSISFWQAVGLSALCGCLFKSSSNSTSKKS